MSQTRNRRRKAKKGLTKLSKGAPNLANTIEAINQLKTLEQVAPILEEVQTAVTLLIQDQAEQEQSLARLRFAFTRALMDICPDRQLQIPALVKRFEAEYDQTHAPGLQQKEVSTSEPTGRVDEVDAQGDCDSQEPQRPAIAGIAACTGE